MTSLKVQLHENHENHENPRIKTLNFDEMKKLYSSITTSDAAKEIFKFFFSNHESVTFEELKNFMKNQQNSRLSDEFIKNAMKDYSNSGSSNLKLNLAEFSLFMKKHMTIVNHDKFRNIQENYRVGYVGLPYV
jgi:Ca2+-binding EF-hand superfamily protein